MTVKPEEYLDPEFDPNKLTISSICSILSYHGVEVPSSRQRKEVYVELFQKELSPKASKILQEMNQVVASDEGITVVPAKSSIPVKKSAQTEFVDLIEDEPAPDYLIKEKSNQKEKLNVLVTTKPSLIHEKRKLGEILSSDENVPPTVTAVTPSADDAHKKLKTSLDVKFVDAEHAFERPPTPAKMRSMAKKEQIQQDLPGTEVEPPKVGRFLIQPNLPGVRGSVKTLVNVFEGSQDQSRISSGFSHVANVPSVEDTEHVAKCAEPVKKADWKSAPVSSKPTWKTAQAGVAPNGDWKTASIPQQNWKTAPVKTAKQLKKIDAEEKPKTNWMRYLFYILAVSALLFTFVVLNLNKLPEEYQNLISPIVNDVLKIVDTKIRPVFDRLNEQFPFYPVLNDFGEMVERSVNVLTEKWTIAYSEAEQGFAFILDEVKEGQFWNQSREIWTNLKVLVTEYFEQFIRATVNLYDAIYVYFAKIQFNDVVLKLFRQLEEIRVEALVFINSLPELATKAYAQSGDLWTYLQSLLSQQVTVSLGVLIFLSSLLVGIVGTALL